MILNKLIQLLILTQPIFFIMMLRMKYLQLPESFKTIFYITCAWFFAFVFKTKLTVFYYTPNLFQQYTILIAFAVLTYNSRYPIKEAISLGFLTVFLNSYYWEFAIHIVDYINTFPNWFSYLHIFLPQLWRLSPLVYFIPEMQLSRDNRNLLINGVIMSACIMMIRLYYFVPNHTRCEWLYFFNRFACLVILLKVVTEGLEWKKKKIMK